MRILSVEVKQSKEKKWNLVSSGKIMVNIL